MQIQAQEARVILAIKAIQSNKKISCRTAAQLYNVPKATVRFRMSGRTTMADIRPKVQNLTVIEEEVIVKYNLHLDTREYPPLIDDVAAMANYVLHSRNARPVGKQWPYRFVQRREELKYVPITSKGPYAKIQT